MQLRHEDYGWGFEYSVSCHFTDNFDNSTILAMQFYRQFHQNLDRYKAVKAYEGLSKEAKAAFNVVCLEGYLELSRSPSDRRIAEELFQTELVRKSDIPFNEGFELLATSQAMEVYSRLKGSKP